MDQTVVKVCQSLEHKATRNMESNVHSSYCLHINAYSEAIAEFNQNKQSIPLQY
jgi:hypothetical protein